MNREELEFSFIGHPHCEYYESKLKEFFDSNICILKGVNRHEFADIIHAYAEGAEVQFKWDIADENFDSLNGLLSIVPIYHIKPSEPVYEYLYYDTSGYTEWKTPDEAEKSVYRNILIQAVETKRIRE